MQIPLALRVSRGQLTNWFKGIPRQLAVKERMTNPCSQRHLEALYARHRPSAKESIKEIPLEEKKKAENRAKKKKKKSAATPWGEK